jgi:hypothetical protein
MDKYAKSRNEMNKAIDTIQNLDPLNKKADGNIMLNIIKRAHQGKASKDEIEAIETVIKYNHVFFTKDGFKAFKRQAKETIKKALI